MTRTQRIQLAMSETRQKLGELLDLEERSEEQQAEIDGLAQKARNLDRDLQAALLAEPEPREIRTETTGEGREANKLLRRSRLGNYLRAALTGGQVDGAERELRAALLPGGGGDTTIPIDILDPGPAPEQRADAATSLSVGEYGQELAPVLSRIFSRSVASRLNVEMPMVPAGQRSFPVFNSGDTAVQRSKGAVKDAVAATFDVTDLPPTRLTARYVFSLEDAAGFPELESSLRRDLAQTTASEMDRLILRGSGVAPNPQGILTALSITAESTSSNYQNSVNKVAALPDGINSFSMSDCRLMLGSATYARFAGLTNSSTRFDLLRYCEDELQSVFVSDKIPAPASNVQSAIAVRTMHQARHSVAPIWRGLELIRDVYTEASAGQIALTSCMLWNFRVLRSSAFVGLSFKLN